MLNREAKEIVRKHAIRLGVDLTKAILNMEVFATKVGLVENQGKTIGKNPTSSARGLYQFLEGSIEPAVRRCCRTIGMMPWMIEALTHNNANLISRENQTTLFIGDILEKKGSDLYSKEIMGSGCISSMLMAYYRLHHTNPDAATMKYAEKIFYDKKD